jgi:hypothetical protein
MKKKNEKKTRKVAIRDLKAKNAAGVKGGKAINYIVPRYPSLSK